MKKLLLLSVLSIAAVSCKKEEVTVDFTYYEDLTTPGKVVFQDLSKNATTYHWTFGDGATSSEKSPEHVYPENGTYEVKLNVTGMKISTKYVQVTTH